MILSVKHLKYQEIQEGVKWLEEYVGPRKFFLHNQRGGEGWRYYEHERVVDIKDDRSAIMFALKFGGGGE